MKNLIKKISLLLTIILLSTTTPLCAKNISYDEIMGNISYESKDTLDTPSSLLIGIYDTLTGKLVNVKSQPINANSPLNVSIDNFKIPKNDFSNYNVKVFNWDASDGISPFGATLFNSTLSNIKKMQTATELKDIQKVTLYKQVDNTVVETDYVDSANLSQYVAKVEMKNMPNTYSSISKVDATKNEVTLDIPNTITVLPDGNITNGTLVKMESPTTRLDDFFAEVLKNPSGTYTLTNDLDASMYTTTQATTTAQADADAAFMTNFTGTIDGNGHKILNLKVPLFLSTQNANIKNLIIENANIRSGNGGRTTGRFRNGTVAMTMNGGTIKNVHVKGYYVSSSSWSNNFRAGGLVAYASNNSVFDSCSVTDFNIDTFWNKCGGIVGELQTGSIKNCYVQGKIGNIDRNHANTQIGGLVGYANNATINNNITDVTITSNGPFNNPVGGLVGFSAGATKGNSNLSLSSTINAGYKSVISNDIGKYTNCFELSSKKGTSSANGVNITEITDDILKNEAFYKTTLALSHNIWNTYYMSITSVPMLKGDYPYEITGGSSIANAYIPNYFRMRENKNFSSSKEILYNNLNKIYPFKTSETLLEIAKKIPPEHTLNQKLIKYLFPLENGKNKVDITTQNYSAITGLLIVFTDETTQNLTLCTPTCENGIASYIINEYDIPYSFDKYALNTNNTVVSKVAEKIKTTSYGNDLLPIVGTTPNPTITLKTDNTMLCETAQSVITDNVTFANKLLSSTKNYNTDFENPIVTQLLEKEFDASLQKNLYAYIYYKNWYNIDFDNIYLADLIFFNSKYYSDSFDLATVTETVIGATPNQRLSQSTNDFFKNRLTTKTGFSDVGTFMDNNIKVFTGETDYPKWFNRYFKGVSIERTVPNLPNIDSRTYTALKTTRGGSFFLPVLTYNLEDLYLLSVPSQLCFGPLSSYNAYNTVDGRKAQIQTLNNMADKFQTYYDVSSSFIDNAENRLKDIKQFQIDSFNEDSKGWVLPADSTLPAKKYFYQAIKIGIANNGSAAYADGSFVSWVVYKFMGTFGTATHETTHNQDGRYLLEGKGRRPGSNAESYARGLLEQAQPDDRTFLNFSITYSPSSDFGGNLDPYRINSPAKIQDFHKKYYEALYTVDLLEAEALLSLDSEVQRKLLYRYTMNTAKNASTWASVPTAEEYKALNITSYKDFAKNNLNITRTFNAPKSRAIEPFKIATLDNAHFSSPYNENGWGDPYTERRLGFELMAKSGYSRGFVGWLSYTPDGVNVAQTDLQALQYATNDPTMTFERFNTEKYFDIEPKIDQNAYFNKKQYVELFKTAFLQDYKNNSFDTKNKSGELRLSLFKSLSRQTNNFETSIYEPKKYVEISSATEFINTVKPNSMVNYKLTADLDFSDITTTSNSYIDGIFVGSIEGNGFKIKNLKKPLFSNIKYSSIQNVIIQNANIDMPSTSQIGAITKNAFGSDFYNVQVSNSTIIGASSVGGLVGVDNRSVFDRISVNATIKSLGIYCGGIVGNATSSIMTNSYSLGNLTTSNDCAGGLIGMIRTGIVSNCYSNMTMEATGGQNAGSLIGKLFVTKGVSYNRIENSVAFGSGTKMRKLDGNTTPSANILSDYINTYEFENSTGISLVAQLGTQAQGKVDIATLQNTKDINFYTNILKFNPEIWDLSAVATGGLPTLTATFH